MTYELLTIKQVQDAVQLTRSSLYRLMKEGRFPIPVKVSARANRWRSDELAAWLDARPRAEGEYFPAATQATSNGGAVQATA